VLNPAAATNFAVEPSCARVRIEVESGDLVDDGARDSDLSIRGPWRMFRH